MGGKPRFFPALRCHGRGPGKVGPTSTAEVVIAGGGVAGLGAGHPARARRACRSSSTSSTRFPREKACAEGLMPAGVGGARPPGPARPAIGGRRFRGIRYRGFGRSVQAAFPSGGGLRPGAGPAPPPARRALFATARATAGIVARGRRPVEGPLVEHRARHGVLVDGQIRRARWWWAPMGPRSRLRRRLALEAKPAGSARLGLRVHYRLAGGRRAADHVEIFVGDGPRALRHAAAGRRGLGRGPGRPRRLRTTRGRLLPARAGPHRPLRGSWRAPSRSASWAGGPRSRPGPPRRSCPAWCCWATPPSRSIRSPAPAWPRPWSRPSCWRGRVRGPATTRLVPAQDDVLAEFDRERRALYREPASSPGCC